MHRSVGYSQERCLLALRGYWDELDTLRDELDLLGTSDLRAVRSCQVQFEQLLRDLDGDLDVRRGPAAIVRMSEVEANTLVPVLRAVRKALGDLPELPDRSWVEAIGAAQRLLQDASRELARLDHGALYARVSAGGA